MVSSDAKLGLGIAVSVFWVVCAIVLIVFVAIQRNQELAGSNLAQATAKDTNIGTLTSFTDTQLNTWSFLMASATGVAGLQYVWKPPTSGPKVVWDSVNGSCGPNQLNYVSMTLDANVFTRTQGVTLGQTPMFLDNQGVQRTFRLQLYNADVRIESTNGDNRFWSVFGTNILKPFAWPSSISNGNVPLWSNGAPPNFALYGQFLQDGNLVVQNSNGFNQIFRASTFSNPVC
jgi:hypothetical protein